MNGMRWRFAYDCHRCFCGHVMDVVLGLKPAQRDQTDPFEHILEEMRKCRNVQFDSELPASDLKELVERYRSSTYGRDVSPGSHGEVGRHWSGFRILEQSSCHCVPGATYFSPPGDCRQHSGHGVWKYGRRLRHGGGLHAQPVHGENVFYGEYLINAQGGRCRCWYLCINKAQKQTPAPLSRRDHARNLPAVDEARRKLGVALLGHAGHRVHHPEGEALLDAPDRGKAWCSRPSNCAVDMVRANFITKGAHGAATPDQLNQLPPGS